MVLPLLLLMATRRLSPGNDLSSTWDSLAKAIRTLYYAHDSRKAEVDKRLAHYAPLATAATSRTDFAGIINKMLVEFGDSHFDFATSTDQNYYVLDGLLSGHPEPLPNIGAWFKPVSGGYELSMLLEGGAAQQAGLRKGDLLFSADGKPFAPVDSLAAKVGRSVVLGYIRNGHPLTATLSVGSMPANEMFLKASEQSFQIIHSGTRAFGYVHPWEMINDNFRRVVEEAADNSINTDGFILDLRDGFGGRPEGFDDVFFRPGDVLETKLAGTSTKALLGYDKPLVVLVNEGTRSARELLAYVFQRSKRALIVGQHTAGAVLGTFPLRLNDWAIIEMPRAEMLIDGESLEKVGVEPDFVVPKEFDADGDDLCLAKAIDTLTRETAGKKG